MLVISWNSELRGEAALGVSHSRLVLAVPGQVLPVAMINDVLLTSLPVTGHKIAGKENWAEIREGGDSVGLRVPENPGENRVKCVRLSHFAET